MSQTIRLLAACTVFGPAVLAASHQRTDYLPQSFCVETCPSGSGATEACAGAFGVGYTDLGCFPDSPVCSGQPVAKTEVLCWPDLNPPAP